MTKVPPNLPGCSWQNEDHLAFCDYKHIILHYCKLELCDRTHLMFSNSPRNFKSLTNRHLKTILYSKTDFIIPTAETANWSLLSFLNDYSLHMLFFSPPFFISCLLSPLPSENIQYNFYHFTGIFVMRLPFLHHESELCGHTEWIPIPFQSFSQDSISTRCLTQENT